jgi:protein-disulfide isomerase
MATIGVRVRFCLIAALLLPAVIFAGGQVRPADGPSQEEFWTKVTKNSGAPVKVVEFFDYQCPFCAATIPALETALKSYPGKVQLILKNFPLSIHPDAMLAHQAALAAGEQGKFWQMHALLYAHQRNLKRENLLDYARQLGLDIPQFEQRLGSNYYKAAVDKDLASAQAMGIHGTPTFFINGRKLDGAQSVDGFKREIEIALGLRQPDTTAKPQAPIKSVKDLDLSHSPLRGNVQAPITIIEFSDMECPFCAKVSPTLKELMDQYPGQIKWIFKNFPLSFHADSALAHRAALAAGRQGKFWEMHDSIFAHQRALKRDDLIETARGLNLDMARFMADLDDKALQEAVESDIKDGAELNVTGTPTFFIGGKEYSGARSLDQFRSILEKQLPLSAGNGAQPLSAADAQAVHVIAVGSADAPVTLTWYSDLASHLTLQATLQLRDLLNRYPGKIRVLFKNRPLESHADAMRLHEAALAADAQDKFWQMHDLIIANPQKGDKATLLSYALRLGLDVKRFEADLDGGRYQQEIRRDLAEARSREVLGAPVFFVNSIRIDGLRPQEVMNDIVAVELAKALHASARRP